MHEITVLSGKGGAGKTSITAALCALANQAVICDNDVDAADLFLLLNPKTHHTASFSGAYTAQINSERCKQCGLCAELCHFNAIEQNKLNQYQINTFSCEGCRLCERTCPQEAIYSEKSTINKWHISDTKHGPFIHAQMGVGEENSGKLVTFIRKKAREKAQKINASYIISDGPPGVGCPVIASISGTQRVLLVIESSNSGWHDAKRLIQLINSFKVPITAVLNKTDINNQLDNLIENSLKKLGIPLIVKIPHSHLFREAMLKQQNIVEYAPASHEAKLITTIWKTLMLKKVNMVIT